MRTKKRRPRRVRGTRHARRIIGIILLLLCIAALFQFRRIEASDSLLQFIENREGFSASWYDDCTGTPTIGYGHTGSLPSGFTAPLSKKEAERLLQHDLTAYTAAVQTTFRGYHLKQHQIDALISFTYNVGISGMQRSQLVRDIKAGKTDPATIRKDFLSWQWATVSGKKQPVLKKRRLAESAMFVSATYAKTDNDVST